MSRNSRSGADGNSNVKAFDLSHQINVHSECTSNHIEMIMKFNHINIFWILFGIMNISCDLSTGPGSASTMREEMHRIINVPWSLSKARFGGKEIDTDPRHGYRLLFNDSTMYGYDGCNWFHGDYTTTNGMIHFPNGIWSTAMACFDINYLNPCQIPIHCSIQILDSTLLLFSGDTSFVMTSKFIEPAERYSFIGKRWRLDSSNDGMADTLRSLGVFPDVEFRSDRTFLLRWNHEMKNNELRFNYLSGSIGIASDSTISTYIRYSSQIIGIRSLKVDTTLEGILRSDRITIGPHNIDFRNSSTKTSYTFIEAK